MTKPATKMPRYPANPDAPKFTPEAWVQDGSKTEKNPEGLAVSSNCYQYAIAGSKADGSNMVYDEVSPGPGQTDGYLTNQYSYTKSKILELSAIDGLKISSLRHDKLPPNKTGHYIVGVYVKNMRKGKDSEGSQDYHYIRQDSDGGWSEKQGYQNLALVQRYADPARDGGYITLPNVYGIKKSYKFAGYAYVPKQGIDGGLEEYLIPPILANLAYSADGCAVPKAFFDLTIGNRFPKYRPEMFEYAKGVGQAMRKHGITEAVEAYEACLGSYAKIYTYPPRESELSIDSR